MVPDHYHYKLEVEETIWKSLSQNNGSVYLVSFDLKQYPINVYTFVKDLYTDTRGVGKLGCIFNSYPRKKKRICLQY